jgi:hypothetical protein
MQSDLKEKTEFSVGRGREITPPEPSLSSWRHRHIGVQTFLEFLCRPYIVVFVKEMILNPTFKLSQSC